MQRLLLGSVDSLKYYLHMSLQYAGICLLLGVAVGKLADPKMRDPS